MAETPIGPGTLLAGRFVLEDLLAETEGARFYRATDRVLARDVAVHVVAADDVRSDALLLAARTSATVSDGHLLRVLDAASEDGITYVVNEWGSGISLDKLLSEGPLSARRAAWVVKEVAEAVAAAHRHGIAHGRLIPENVVITDSGSVKLIGFVVDAVLRGRIAHPQSGGAALDEHEADVLNLGALLYAGLVARWPGTEGCRLPAAPVEGGRTLRPRQVRAGVPRPLDAICERVLNRDDHHQVLPIDTAHEIYAALSDYIGDPAAAVPTGLEPEDTLGEEPTTAVPRPDPEETQASAPVFYDADSGVGWMHAESARGLRADDPDATRATPPPPPPPPPFEEPAERPLFVPGAPRRAWADPIDEGPDSSSLAAPPSGAATGWAGAGRTGGSLPPTWGPDATDDTGQLEAGTWADDEPGRNWLRLAISIGVVLILVVAVLLAFNLGRGGTTASDEPAADGSTAGTPDAAPKPVQIAEVTDFDPEGDPPEENPELAPLAADGDPGTAWRSLTYEGRPDLGGLKSGVGLLVDLGEPTEVSEVALTLVGSPTAVQILSAGDATGTPTSTDGLTEVAGDEAAGAKAVLELDEPVTTQYLVVWLTSLPAAEGGFVGQIAEIVVRS